MSVLRGLAVSAMVLVAVVLQSAVLSPVAVHGVVPDLALILVVAASLVRGPEFGSAVGFFAGLCVDLAPPADHVAGRWALALGLVGFLVGRLRQDTRTPLAAVAAVGAATFVGTSLFALSGMVVSEGPESVSAMLSVIGISVLLNVVLAPLLLPGLMHLFRRLQPARAELSWQQS